MSATFLPNSFSFLSSDQLFNVLPEDEVLSMKQRKLIFCLLESFELAANYFLDLISIVVDALQIPLHAFFSLGSFV